MSLVESGGTTSSNKRPIVRAENIFKINANNSNLEAKGLLPMTPWVEIQFRTNIVSNIKDTPTKKNEWTTVSFRAPDADTYKPPINTGDSSSLKFDNYFENITLEDNGGVVKCNMTLFDKDLDRLENIIIKSVMATKGGNEIIMNKLQNATPKAILEFMPNPTSNINFRVRFGYSDANNSPNIFTPTLKTSSDWQERTSIKKIDSLYLKSPWMYFMMMDTQFNLTQKGLSVNVSGISMSNSFFDKTKIIKRFALMKGTPKKLFNSISEQLFYATRGRVQVVDAVATGSTNKVGVPIIPEGEKSPMSGIKYGEPSDIPVQWAVTPKEGSDTQPDSLSDIDKKDLEESSKWLNISISLGGEPRYERDDDGKSTGRIINEYMSVKDLLNDFVNKVPPILRNKNTNKYVTDPEEIKKITSVEKNDYDTTIYEPISYTYSINEQTNEKSSGADTDTIVVIRFFYRRLDNTKQEYIRSYDYRQSPSSIITAFSVKNSLDFIQLNQSVIVKGKDLDVYLSTPTKEIDGNEGSTPADVSELYKQQLENDNFTLVNRIVENNGDSSGNLLASKVVNNMNQGIFYGNIEILGDPYYLFDSVLQPYQYYIKLNIYRNYNEYNNKKTGILNQSYLTGYYLIKKITHKLDISGFRTTLDVQRYPTTGIET